jgi:hypothetical protein
MKTVPIYALSLEPIRIWSAVAWKFGELMLASAQVIGYRTGQMLSPAASSGSRNTREFALMGQEKVSAALESGRAVALDSVALGQQLGTIAVRQMLANMTAFMSLAGSRSVGDAMNLQGKIVGKAVRDSANGASRLSRSGGMIAKKSLKPIHSRATANARRLGKK